MTALSMSSISNAALFSGAAKAFTSINPLAAGITGAIIPISAYALDKILPELSLQCSDDILANIGINSMARAAITHLGGFVLGTLAANAMGYSISLTGAILLGLSSNVVLVGVAFAVINVAARILTAEGQRNAFIEKGIEMLDTIGHPLVAMGVSILSATCTMESDATEEVPEQGQT